MTSNPEAHGNPPAAASVRPPKAKKRPPCATQAPCCARQAKVAKRKASSTEQWPKRQKAAKQAKPAAGAREGSKAANVLGLLRRSDGASLKELMKATGWLAHSVRGFLSGTVAKRLGLDLVSAKSEDRERLYCLKG